jgi:hypothetical protein
MFTFYTCCIKCAAPLYSYHFAVDISAALPTAEEYPMEFAFSNFIYWHSRKDDVILILGDREDLFGTTALYCSRRVLIAPFPDVDEDDAGAIEKAYRTMASLMRRKETHFSGYAEDAAFATISRLARNVRSSTIDVNAILMSQTMEPRRRFVDQLVGERDLITPCKMVRTFTL